MTIEEKRQALLSHCTEAYCDACVLKGAECDFNNIEEITTAYDIISAEIDQTDDKSSEDPIKPSYYNDTKITPFDVIDDWDLGFYLGNAIKYIKRAGKKANNSRLQDLRKVREYIDHEIKAEEATYGRN